MKMTVFLRILTATLLPVLLVIIIVIGTARAVIHTDGVAYAKEFTRFAAKQISEQTAIKLENAAVLQDEISVKLAALDFKSPGAKAAADVLLNTLQLSNRELYSTWFAFERGVFDDERYYKTLLRTENGIIEIFDMNDELLDDKSASPWYNVPLDTGGIYADVSDYYDFGSGEGYIHTFTMAYPVISPHGDVLGCVGLDIRYDNLFPLSQLTADGVRRIMLVSEQGTILYSSEKADTDGSLWDYGFQNPEAVLQTISDRGVWQETVDSPFSGESLLACLYPVDIFHTGQTVYLYRDTAVSSLYSSFYSSMEIIIAAGVLGMLLLAFSVFFSTRGIVRHVKRITDSFYHVANISAEGTLEGEHIPIADTKIHELDILQSALVRMMIQLRRAHEHRVKAVEAEVEKEKLIASAKAKTNFFAAMSHEIRTPMNAIMGISEIMLHDGGLTKAQEKNIRDIKISADSLLSIINDILDISKLETGKMELHPEHYNFRALIDNIVSLASHLAAGGNLEFVFEPEGELPLCLFGDSARLRQVLLNLIGNAVKFTRKGRVALRVTVLESTLVFSVIDTGVGINPGEIDSIFESFKRLDTRKNRDVKGAGLGLSISRNLVEMMSGTIDVKSINGKGSTFSVTIPLVLGDESKLRQARPPSTMVYSPALRVLVVDDDKTNLHVSSNLFRAVHGIRCDTAGSGQLAIKMVQQTDYDIIFMDYMMPELDGIDTTRRIRGLGEKYQKIPIIALTANAVIGTKKELISAGMDDFLAKPIQSDRLSEILGIWVPEDKRLPAPGSQPESIAADTLEAPLESALERVGVSTRDGMENTGRDKKMYIQSLRLLMERLPNITPVLGSLLERQNMREFHIHIHGLKGSLASVGALLLSGEAEKIEAAAATDDVETCRSLLRPLSDRLWALHDVLRSALPDSAAYESDSVFSGKALKSGLQRLLAALESCDYQAIANELDIIMRTASTSEKHEAILRAKKLVDRFDYAGAAAAASEALSAFEHD